MSKKRSPHATVRSSRVLSKPRDGETPPPAFQGAMSTTVTRAEAQACSAVLQEEAPALAPTCWLDVGNGAPPDSVSIRFTGSRLGVEGRPQAPDRFTVIGTFDGIGAGVVALTTTVRDINPGESAITAERVVPRNGVIRVVETLPVSRQPARPNIQRTLTEWGTSRMLPDAQSRITTSFAPLAAAAGTFPVAWPALVSLGVVVGLVLLDPLCFKPANRREQCS